MMTLESKEPRFSRSAAKVSAAMVARASDVSTATVSYVLNGQSGVSLETRERVLEVAKELGFTPKRRASVTPRNNIIGLVLSNIANPFYPELSVGFYEAAQARGYQVFLAHTEDDQESLTRAIGAMLDRKVDGVAVTIARSDNALSVRQLRSTKVPFIQVSRLFPHVEADFVGIDDHLAATEMMRHALTHQRWPLAAVIGPRASSASAGRENGFVAEARAHGIVIPGAKRVSTDITLEGGISAARHLFSLPDPPRSSFAAATFLPSV